MADTASTVRVSDTDIEAFRRDGVVPLRGMFDARWLDMLAAGIDADLRDPGPRLEIRANPDGPGRYIEDFWAWSAIPQFEDFVRNSPAAEIAAALLGAKRINLVMDNWFLREAGSTARAPWHHDISYFDFEGSMCVLWLPMEAVDRRNGIEFVRGSHLWNKLFMRVMFKDHRAGGEAGLVNGQHYEPPPDINAARGDYDIVSFDLERGDCILFDMRTLHGAAGDTVPEPNQPPLHPAHDRRGRPHPLSRRLGPCRTRHHGSRRPQGRRCHRQRFLPRTVAGAVTPRGAVTPMGVMTPQQGAMAPPAPTHWNGRAGCVIYGGTRP